ncbi:MAG: MEDS domain-containing protein, partial [Candidatus Roizmanbacteria bacterium]|nr:MEDS domain-containing protein [Candidatus Roizmanbacteria bacterium]
MSPNILDIKDIKLGDHICSIYQNKEQQFSFVVPFLMDGLMNKNKCIYVAGENSKEEVIFQFENAGFKITDYINSKQLEVVLAKDIYLEGGVFKPEGLLNTINNLKEAAI